MLIINHPNYSWYPKERISLNVFPIEVHLFHKFPPCPGHPIFYIFPFYLNNIMLDCLLPLRPNVNIDVYNVSPNFIYVDFIKDIFVTEYQLIKL